MKKIFLKISDNNSDEFGRLMTPKESFREISHKFHGVNIVIKYKKKWKNKINGKEI
jgi:hypothetical protein